MFQSGSDSFRSDDLTPSKATAPLPERERLQVILISSRDGVIETIQNLHRRGFAEAGAWSPLLPAPNLGEVMSIYTRYRKREG